MYNGHVVIDADCHIREYADLDRTFRDNIDPAYREAYDRLSETVHAVQQRPNDQVLFMRAGAVVGATPERRPLGVYDTFGATAALRGAGGNGNGAAAAPPRSRADEIDPACNWDPAVRLRDMDTAGIDVGIMFSSQSDGFCVLRDVGFEVALQRAYNRYMNQYCAGTAGRLRWIANSAIRDVSATVDELTYWAERDDNLAGIFIPRACPDGRLLDNPDLHPIFRRSEELDLPVWVHGGTMRPPLTPGATELDNAGFIINAVYHGWGGQTAAAALIGGGILDLFPRLRVGIFESGCGWMPWFIEKLDDAYRPSSGMTPFLKRKPSEVVAEGRLFCSVDAGEDYLEHAVEVLGDDIWLFSTDYPHPGTSWPDGVSRVTQTGLSESAKTKILGENAMRFLPKLAAVPAGAK